MNSYKTSIIKQHLFLNEIASKIEQLKSFFLCLFLFFFADKKIDSFSLNSTIKQKEKNIYASKEISNKEKEKN